MKILWTGKINFLLISEEAIHGKIEKVIKTYDECTRSGKYEVLNEVSDDIIVNGEWLNADNKVLYHLQMETNCQVMYSTEPAAWMKAIHLSEQRE